MDKNSLFARRSMGDAELTFSQSVAYSGIRAGGPCVKSGGIGPPEAGSLDIKLSITLTCLTYASNDVIMLSKYDCFNGKEV